MNKFAKGLYYTRLVTFIISLILIFLMMRTIVRVGIYGYLFLIVEFIYITLIILMILSKKKKYKFDIAFNVMQIGTYIYLGIIFMRTLNWHITSISLSSYVFYRNNFIILIVLLLILILYIIAITYEKKRA